MLLKKELDILKSILAGNWTLNNLNHNFDDEYFIDNIQDKIDIIYESNLKITDDPNHKNLIDKFLNGESIVEPECLNKDVYISFLQLKFLTINHNGKLYFSFESQCEKCGSRFSKLHIDEEAKEINLVRLISEETKACEVEDIEFISSKIKVDKNLLFTNFFKQNDNLMFSDKSINYMSGLIYVSEKNAEIDVLFGQTGNMSVHIYKKGDTLHILDCEIEDRLEDFDYIVEDFSSESELSKKEIYKLLNNDAEKLVDLGDVSELFYQWPSVKELDKYKHWEYMGKVSCEMWRYMATSSSNIKTHDLEIDHWTDEPVVVDLKSGEYEMKHYYHVSDQGPLVSEISLV